MLSHHTTKFDPKANRKQHATITHTHTHNGFYKQRLRVKSAETPSKLCVCRFRVGLVMSKSTLKYLRCNYAKIQQLLQLTPVALQ